MIEMSRKKSHVHVYVSSIFPFNKLTEIISFKKAHMCELISEVKEWEETQEEQTWLAVAVAKGTLVADVVAADTVAGEAPCIMGTWGKDQTSS